MAEYPRVPFYLFFGNQADAILGARDAVLSAILDPESRDQNLTEYYPTGPSDTIKLASYLDEIAGDFAMVSLFPDVSKCVIATNPAEIFSRSRSGGKKIGSKDEERLAKWLERELPQTGNTLILLAFEDESAQREVDKKSSIFQVVQKIGYLRGFSDTKAFFRIEDAITRRQPSACIEAMRDLWKPGKGDSAVYHSVVRCLRFLLQANIARERQWMRDPAAQAVFFPADPKSNLFKAHPNVQGKYTAFPVYRTADLVKAYQGLLNVYRALRPRPGDEYVPDALGLLEQTLLELITSPRPRRTS